MPVVKVSEDGGTKLSKIVIIAGGCHHQGFRLWHGEDDFGGEIREGCGEGGGCNVDGNGIRLQS